MRTVEEIRDYLDVCRDVVSEQLIKDAQIIEEEYEEELSSGNYGYAIEADFINSPFIIEDEDITDELIKVAQVGGVVLYRIVLK